MIDQAQQKRRPNDLSAIGLLWVQPVSKGSYQQTTLAGKQLIPDVVFINNKAKDEVLSRLYALGHTLQYQCK